MSLKINENLTIPLHAIEGGQLYYEFEVFFDVLRAESDKRFPDKIWVAAQVEKVDKDYLVKIKIKTRIYLICDRCGEAFNQKILKNIRVLSSFKYEENDYTRDYAVKLLNPHSRSIEINQEVLDELILSIPQKVLCNETCKGLCGNCGANLNQIKCDCPKQRIDPRWLKLNNLDFKK